MLSEAEESRWNEIKAQFRKQKVLGGAGENDPVTRVIALFRRGSWQRGLLMPSHRV